jgi:chemotaxis protein MotB
LILSFAEFNVPKFKQISGSLKNAFGVQKIVPIVEQPKGTTVLSLTSVHPQQNQSLMK